jgi:hypothetical protein
MRSWILKILIAIASIGLVCFAALPPMRAVSSPPDGGYANFNTAEGNGALFALTTGLDNTAIGEVALAHLTIGSENTATGAYALSGNQTGSNNTATGSRALLNNTASDNTATGSSALSSNTTGEDNTAWDPLRLAATRSATTTLQLALKFC